MRPFHARIAACVVATTIVLWGPLAGAQQRTGPRLDPADPAAKVPPATYRSSFADYRPIGNEAVGDWRAANDEVGRIGGWREYLREAQAPEGNPSGGKPAASQPQTPAHGGHGGHGMHGGKK